MRTGTIAQQATMRKAQPVLRDPYADETHEQYLDRLLDWAERQALQGAADLDDVAAEAEDRQHPPNADLQAGEDWSGASMLGIRSGSASSPAAGTMVPRPLGSTRGYNSTVTRYLKACQRVDEAFEAVSCLLGKLRDDAAAGWSAAAMRRYTVLTDRIEAFRRRQQNARRCATADVCVFVYRCCRCQHEKLGAPLTCQQRTCPRCVRKIRRQHQAQIIDLLDVVERRRRRDARAPPRWRFVTLTVPSSKAFAAGKTYLGRCWGRLLRTKLWQQVGACVAALETTHTSAGWHVHVHALIDCFLPRPIVVRRWQLAALRAILHDSRQERPAFWHGEPIAGAARRYLETLDRVARRAPATWSAVRALQRKDLDEPLLATMFDRAANAKPDQQLVELHDIDAAIGPSTAPADDASRATIARVLAMLPRAAGQHLSEPQGSREQIVRELCKYLAKDLGCAGVPDEQEYGVAGTADRLAEFMLGSFGWRTLRGYGDAYFAAQDQERPPALECEHCGSDDVRYDRRDWYTRTAWRRVELAQRRRTQQDRAPPQPVAIRPRDPDWKLHELVRYSEDLRCQHSRLSVTRTGGSMSCCAGSAGDRATPRRRSAGAASTRPTCAAPAAGDWFDSWLADLIARG